MPQYLAKLCALGLVVLWCAPASAQKLGNFAVVELQPGSIWDGHVFFEGIEVQHFHPESPTIEYDSHGMSVAARFFQDNGKSARTVDAGKASRDKWGLISYQAEEVLIFEQALEELSKSARIINHSSGFSFDSSGNTHRAVVMDSAAYNKRVLITQSAANEGPSELSLRDPAGIYNGIVVGATSVRESLPSTDPFRAFAEDAYLPWYTSRGPTADGRIKPDLVAPGTYIWLPNYTGDPPVADSLRFTAGTSFAAPYVGGVAASLIEKAEPLGINTDPLVLKAVLLNSTQEVQKYEIVRDGEKLNEVWDGWTPSTTNRPLDKDQGTGELSTPRAEWQYLTNPEQAANSLVTRVGWDHDKTLLAEQKNWYLFREPVQAGATLTATLNWFREYTEDGVPKRLDNLDLELWKTDGRTPLERITLSNSTLDNVEHIHRFDVPEAGFYALSVNFSEDLSDNGAAEYALAWMLPDSTFFPGDTNLDGKVNLQDFTTLKEHFGQEGGYGQGDINLDAKIDLADFAILKNNFGAPSRVTVPEPSSVALLAFPLVLIVFRSTQRGWCGNTHAIHGRSS